MIKAVFIDIDETLTNSKREVTEKTLDQIKRCIEKGILIILTSGRARKDAINYQKQIGASPYIISSNGASCYDELEEKEIFIEPIKKQVANQLLEYAEENGYTIKFNYKDEIVINKAVFLDEKEIITIGDGENDISMFNITPNSVAMGNALEYIKRQAKYITSSNDEDGVAKVLEKL